MHNENPVEPATSVVSVNQIECVGYEADENGMSRRCDYLGDRVRVEKAVSAIVTTFRDGMARVSCPHLHKSTGLCNAGRLTAACPYNQVVENTNSQSPSVETLGLSVRAKNGLMKAGIINAHILAQQTPDRLLKIKNFGEITVDEIREALAKIGMKLKEE